MNAINQATIVEMPLAMSAETFAETGHKLIDMIAGFLNELPHKPVTTGEQPTQIRKLLGNTVLPVNGTSAESIIKEAATLLFNHSLFNGHPNFWGYITSSATPIGALGDLLAAAVNPNAGAYILSPMATEIERQTIEWLAEFVGFPAKSSGLFVSGGNMANLIGFLAARKAKVNWDIRKEGLINAANKQLLIYCSKGTHTWIQKAADLSGLGTNAIRWIDMNDSQQINIEKLKKQIAADVLKGYTPFFVAGTAGSVSTGAVDDFSAIAKVCKQYNLWFHIDGAYGAPAAMLPELADIFKGLDEADSVAIDPHKWLYSPLEAGCILVKDAQQLRDAFSFHPEYYNFDGDAEDPGINYFDYGLQNSRGFRALKVWMCIKQAGRSGYEKMIRRDIALAKKLCELIAMHAELEVVTNNLSITTFRYIPKNLSGKLPGENYFNKLNEALLNKLQAGGKVFLSNAVINDKYCLRVCIVNFRTTTKSLELLVETVLNEGKKLHAELNQM